MAKSRGFTLIELSVTVTVLIIFAAMMAPAFARIKEQSSARDLMPSMVRLIGFARESSINQGIPLIVSFDSSANAMQVTSNDYQNQNAPQPIDGVFAPPSGTPAGGSGSRSSQNPNLQFPGQAMEIQNLPVGASAETFQLAGKESSSADFRLRFYPDGTCDGGGITFRQGNAQHSLSVDKLGGTKITDGPLPDPTTVIWEAGQLAQRSS
jgi:prepilin-type N-terminal cleavage/methylation domain-containing protein